MTENNNNRRDVRELEEIQAGLRAAYGTPPPLDAWTEVLTSSIDESRVLAARDLKPGDVVLDLVLDPPPRDVEPGETHPTETTTWRHQPRSVAQHIAEGDQLYIGTDGRVYGAHAKPEPAVATFAGVPVQVDDEIPTGTVQFRNAEGRTLAQLKLDTLAGDEIQAEYAERLVLQGHAQPFVHRDDAGADAPKRYDPEARGFVDETATGWPDLEGDPLTEDQKRVIQRVLASALGELDQVTGRQGRVESIYVASSWRNPHQPAVVERLREETAAEVYDFRNPPGRTGFAWSEIDPDWMTWTAAEYVEALEHPAAIAGYHSDFDAMQAADTFVLVLPCGRSAHLELGWAVGAGKRTVILTQDGEEPELMAKMVDHIATSLDDVLDWIVQQDAEAHHEDVARAVRLERLYAEIDEIPIPFALDGGVEAGTWSTPPADPLEDLLAAQRLIDGIDAVEEVAAAAAVDVDVASVEVLRDAAAVLRSTDDGPEVIRSAIATGLEHAARTLEAGNPVDDLDEVLEIATALAEAAEEGAQS